MGYIREIYGRKKAENILENETKRFILKLLFNIIIISYFYKKVKPLLRGLFYLNNLLHIALNIEYDSGIVIKIIVVSAKSIGNWYCVYGQYKKYSVDEISVSSAEMNIVR